MKTISPVIVALLFAVSLHAQQTGLYVSGKVTDSLHGAALPYATAILLKDSALFAQQQTDRSGSYLFGNLEPGRYAITIKYLGYKDHTTKPFAITNGPLRLPPVAMSPVQLGLAGVEISSRKPFIEQSPGSATIHVKESPLAAGNTLEEILRRAPGVKVDDNGSISLNGKQVMIYLNGRPSYLEGEALKTLLAATMGSTIDKITLTDNPSVKYDAQAAAVIDITIRKNTQYGLNATLLAGAGSGRYGRYTAGGDMNYRQGKLNIYGGCNYQHNQQYYLTLTDRLLQANGNKPYHVAEDAADIRRRDIHAFHTGVNYDPDEKNSLGILLRGDVLSRGRRYNSTTGFTKGGSSGIDSFLHTAVQGKARFESYMANLFYRHRFDTAGRELTLNGDYYTYHQQWHDLFTTDHYTGHGEAYRPPYVLRDNSPQQIIIRSASADYSHPLGAGTLEAGLKTVFVTTDNDIKWEAQMPEGWVTDAGKTNHFIYRENINAGYVSYSGRFGKAGLQGGLRVERTQVKGHSLTLQQQFSRYYTQLFPHVSLQYQVSGQHQLALAYRRSIDRPDYEYVNPFLLFQNKYSYIQGNPGLNPQTTSSLELTHGFRHQLYTTLSFTRTRNIITGIFREEEQVLVTTYENLSYYDLAAIRLSYSKAFTRWWSTATAVQGFYIRFNYNDAALHPSRPGLSLNSTHTFTLPGLFNIELSGIYTSRASSGLNATGAIWYLNAGLQREILGKRGSLKLGVNDVFRSYRYTSHFRYQHTNVRQRYRYDSRFAMLTFTYRLGNSHVKPREKRRTGIEQEKGRINNNN